MTENTKILTDGEAHAVAIFLLSEMQNHTYTQKERGPKTCKKENT